MAKILIMELGPASDQVHPEAMVELPACSAQVGF
jgi:hypothetical protein